MLQGAGYTIDKGFELLINGEIPTASGLSSSASLELLVGVVLDDLFNLQVPRLELVQLGQKTENEFIGVNSGILDQFAIGFGEVKKAILCCKNYHARRAFMYYQRAYPETEFLVCPCSVDEITKENWKLTQHGIDEVLAEIKRIVSQFQIMMQK